MGERSVFYQIFAWIQVNSLTRPMHALHHTTVNLAHENYITTGRGMCADLGHLSACKAALDTMRWHMLCARQVHLASIFHYNPYLFSYYLILVKA